MKDLTIINKVTDPDHALMVYAQHCQHKRSELEKLLAFVDACFAYDWTSDNWFNQKQIGEQIASDLGINGDNVFFFSNGGGTHYREWLYGYVTNIAIAASEIPGVAHTPYTSLLYKTGFSYTLTQNPATATSHEVMIPFNDFITELKRQYLVAICEENAANARARGITDFLTYLRSKVAAKGLDPNDSYVDYKADQLESSTSSTDYFQLILPDIGVHNDSVVINQGDITPAQDLTGVSPLGFLGLGPIDWSSTWKGINSVANTIWNGVRAIISGVSQFMGYLSNYFYDTFINPDDITLINNEGDGSVRSMSIIESDWSITQEESNFLKERLSLSADRNTSVLSVKTILGNAYAQVKYNSASNMCTTDLYFMPRVLPYDFVVEFMASIPGRTAEMRDYEDYFPTYSTGTDHVTVPGSWEYQLPALTEEIVDQLVSKYTLYSASGSLANAASSEEYFLKSMLMTKQLMDYIFSGLQGPIKIYNLAVTGMITNYTLASFYDQEKLYSFDSFSYYLIKNCLEADMTSININNINQNAMYYGAYLPPNPSYAIKTDKQNQEAAKQALLAVVGSVAAVFIGVGAYKIVSRAKIQARTKFHGLERQYSDIVANGGTLTNNQIRQLKKAERRNSILNGDATATSTLISSVMSSNDNKLEDKLTLVKNLISAS